MTISYKDKKALLEEWQSGMVPKEYVYPSTIGTRNPEEKRKEEVKKTAEEKKKEEEKSSIERSEKKKRQKKDEEKREKEKKEKEEKEKEKERKEEEAEAEEEEITDSERASLFDKENKCRLSPEVIQNLAKANAWLRSVSLNDFINGKIIGAINQITETLGGAIAGVLKTISDILEDVRKRIEEWNRILIEIGQLLAKGARIVDEKIKKFLKLLTSRPQNAFEKNIKIFNWLNSVLSSVRACLKDFVGSINEIYTTADQILLKRKQEKTILNSAGVSNSSDYISQTTAMNLVMPNYPEPVSDALAYYVPSNLYREEIS